MMNEEATNNDRTDSTTETTTAVALPQAQPHPNPDRHQRQLYYEPRQLAFMGEALSLRMKNPPLEPKSLVQKNFVTFGKDFSMVVVKEETAKKAREIVNHDLGMDASENGEKNTNAGKDGSIKGRVFRVVIVLVAGGGAVALIGCTVVKFRHSMELDSMKEFMERVMKLKVNDVVVCTRHKCSTGSMKKLRRILFRIVRSNSKEAKVHHGVMDFENYDDDSTSWNEYWTSVLDYVRNNKEMFMLVFAGVVISVIIIIVQNRKIKHLKSENDQLKSNEKDLKKKVERRDLVIVNRAENSATEINQADYWKNEFEEQYLKNEELKDENKEMKGRIEKLEATTAGLVNNTIGEVHRTHKNFNTLSEKDKTVQGLRDNLNERDATIRTQNDTINTLKETIKNLQNKVIPKLKRKIDVLTEETKDKKRLMQLVGDLRKDVAALNQKVTDLTESVREKDAALAAKDGTLNEKDFQIEQNQLEIAALREEVAGLATTASDLTSQIEELSQLMNGDLEGKMKEVADARAESNKIANAMTAKIDNVLVPHTQEVATAKASIEKLEEERDEIRTKELEDVQRMVQQALVGLEQDKENLSSENANQRQMITKLQQEEVISTETILDLGIKLLESKAPLLRGEKGFETLTGGVFELIKNIYYIIHMKLTAGTITKATHDDEQIFYTMIDFMIHFARDGHSPEDKKTNFFFSPEKLRRADESFQLYYKHLCDGFDKAGDDFNSIDNEHIKGALMGPFPVTGAVVSEEDLRNRHAILMLLNFPKSRHQLYEH